MLETASSMVPPLHRTPTTRRSRFWHSTIDHKIRLYKLRSPTLTVPLRPSLLLGALRGRFLPSPHIIGRLLCYGVRCLPLLISPTSSTTARLRLSASHSITNRH